MIVVQHLEMHRNLAFLDLVSFSKAEERAVRARTIHNSSTLVYKRAADLQKTIGLAVKVEYSPNSLDNQKKVL